MSTRKIVVISTRTSKRIEITTDVTKWGELKTLIGKQGIDTNNMIANVRETYNTLHHPDAALPAEPFTVFLLAQKQRGGIGGTKKTATKTPAKKTTSKKEEPAKKSAKAKAEPKPKAKTAKAKKEEEEKPVAKKAATKKPVKEEKPVKEKKIKAAPEPEVPTQEKAPEKPVAAKEPTTEELLQEARNMEKYFK